MATLVAPCRSSSGRWLRTMPSMVRCSAASSVVTTRAGLGSGSSESTMPTKCGARNRASLVGQPQPFRARHRRRRRVDEAAPLHPRQHHPLPRRGLRQAAPRVEPRRTLRQRGDERRLRRRQHRGVGAEVGVAGALGAGDLVAVGREVQVEREDLGLRQPMLEAQRDDRFLDLGAPATPPRRDGAGRPLGRAGGELGAPIEQQLGDLLRQRRAALDAIERDDVAPRRPRHRDRIDARGARGSDDPRRQASRRPAPAAGDPAAAASRACRDRNAPRRAPRRCGRRPSSTARRRPRRAGRPAADRAGSRPPRRRRRSPGRSRSAAPRGVDAARRPVGGERRPRPPSRPTPAPAAARRDHARSVFTS